LGQPGDSTPPPQTPAPPGPAGDQGETSGGQGTGPAGDSGVSGSVTPPPGFAVPQATIDQVQRILSNSDRNYRGQNPAASPEDRKKNLLTVLDGILKANPKVRNLKADELKFFNTTLVDSIIYGKPQLEGMRADIAKALDQFDLELLQQGTTADRDRADGLRKRLITWLADKKGVQYDRLGAPDKELIENEIGAAMDREFTVAGGSSSKPATGGGNILTIPSNLVSPGVMSVTGYPALLLPRCHLFNHRPWGYGTTYAIDR
jgi:hypothetical protein